LPAIDPTSPTYFATTEAEDFVLDWHVDFRKGAAEILRSYLGQFGDKAVAYATNLALLTTARDKIVTKAYDTNTDIPALTRFDSKTLDALATLITKEEEGELASIQAEQDNLHEIASTIIADGVHTIAIHELQHRIDMLAGSLPLPAALEKYTGALHNADGEERGVASHAAAELSAYLADIARSPYPVWRLFQIARFVLDTNSWATPECYAGLVIIEELAARSNIPIGIPLIQAGSIQRKRIVAILLALAKDENLADSAERAWAELFSRPLTPFKELP
jgi:hypothetical protein